MLRTETLFSLGDPAKSEKEELPIKTSFVLKKILHAAPAGMAQLDRRCPVQGKVASLISHQGMCPGCGLTPL